jgi:hypothetical protein
LAKGHRKKWEVGMRNAECGKKNSEYGNMGQISEKIVVIILAILPSFIKREAF